jgi:uncharacterized membrane protein YphA (DoxX/SURF4 family)
MNSEAMSYMQDNLPTWERRLRKVVLVIARVGLAYLFFTQLLWKMPSSFGCPPDFSFTTADASGRLQRTSGLCDWIGIESVWSTRPRPFFVADMKSVGGPTLSVDLGFAARLNGLFLDNFVKPNIRWFGYVIWGVEVIIFVSLLLGLFTRLGALIAVAQSGQLWIGLAGISIPYEWEWTYTLMVFLSLLMFAFAPGRVLGVDARLRQWLKAAAEGSQLARLALWLT